MIDEDVDDLKEEDEGVREESSHSPNLNVNRERSLSDVEVGAQQVDQRLKLTKKKFWKSSS